jgi:hypothetical protein
MDLLKDLVKLTGKHLGYEKVKLMGLQRDWVKLMGLPKDLQKVMHWDSDWHLEKHLERLML